MRKSIWILLVVLAYIYILVTPIMLMSIYSRIDAVELNLTPKTTSIEFPSSEREKVFTDPAIAEITETLGYFDEKIKLLELRIKPPGNF